MLLRLPKGIQWQFLVTLLLLLLLPLFIITMVCYTRLLYYYNGIKVTTRALIKLMRSRFALPCPACTANTIVIITIYYYYIVSIVDAISITIII